MKVNTTAVGVAKRVKWATQFLGEVLKENIFKSTNEVLIFLSMNKESFEKLQKEIAKSTEPRVISEIPHPEGKADISITRKKTTLLENINKHSPDSLVLYTKFKSTGQKIADTITTLSSLLSTQAEICKSLSSISVDIKVL
jgi:hypothetical protein